MSYGPCPYCDKQMNDDQKSKCFRTKDHVIPQSRGGKVTIFCCKKCNADKAAYPLAEWEAILRFNKDPRADNVAWFIKDHLPNVQALEGVVSPTLNVPDRFAFAILLPVANAIGIDTSDGLTTRQRNKSLTIAKTIIDSLRNHNMLREELQ